MLPAGGRVSVPLQLRPACTADVADVRVTLDAAASGGGAVLSLPVSGAATALAELCPPTDPGVHASVTGTRTDVGLAGVEARVVNRGTERVSIRAAGQRDQPRSRVLIDSGTGLTLAEFNGLDPPPPPPLVGYPALPVSLAPGEAVVLVLQPNVIPCRVGAETVTLQAAGEHGRQVVESQETLTAGLLATARVLCEQRTPGPTAAPGLRPGT